ncbi:MAG: DoxX family protein [Candidatus Hydrogenedentes bacterium]|nr:DoxX family protein [Candidatus Hydrogenedentota bacterium]
MSQEPTSAPVSKVALWAGRTMSTLPVLMLLMSASMKFLQPPMVAEGNAHLGWPMNLAMPLGAVESACTVLYVVPQTSVLGAILLTGYLGGATAAHVRIGESPHMAVLLGMMVWGGLFLRDPRIRALAPWRK